MTDAEDQVRRFVAALERTQRPVEISEVTARPVRRPSARLLTGVAAAVCVVVVAGFVIVDPGGRHHTFVEVAPSTTRSAGKSPGSTVPAPACKAADLAVSGTQGESLHPDWLPAGYVLSQGDENKLGERGNLTYTPPGGGDQPRVELLRYHTVQPLDQLGTGTHHPVTVQGHPAVLSDGVPEPQFTSVAWSPAPDTALVVSGYKLSQADLLAVANGVRYEPGGTFVYPVHPHVTVTRAQALAENGNNAAYGSPILTSVGEVDAITNGIDPFGAHPSVVPGVPPTTPVWVVWDPTSSHVPSQPRTGLVIDADTGARLANIAFKPALSRLTDRNRLGCAPPFGVLTRSEILAIKPTEAGTTQTAILTTLGRFAATRTGLGFAQCGLDPCDPSVPVWVLISTAPDRRFADRERSLSTATTTNGPSWQLLADDARTGAPTTTGLDNTASLGSGAPPADVRALPDLAGP